jgi:hypothetical protein
VPLEAANATAFGDYVNSASFHARGIELSAQAAFAGHFRTMASYMYIDAKTSIFFQRSLISAA